MYCPQVHKTHRNTPPKKRNFKLNKRVSKNGGGESLLPSVLEVETSGKVGVECE